MLVRTFQQLLEAYDIVSLDCDDDAVRSELRAQYPHSLFFEGDFLEFDHVEEWIRKNLKIWPVIFLFYGKLRYDYGFFELFFSELRCIEELSVVIPALFTEYPSGQKARTNGLDSMVEIG